jgi:hypothetical protein
MANIKPSLLGPFGTSTALGRHGPPRSNYHNLLCRVIPGMLLYVGLALLSSRVLRLPVVVTWLVTIYTFARVAVSYLEQYLNLSFESVGIMVELITSSVIFIEPFSARKVPLED